MKTEKKTGKDGKVYTTYKLEAGDKVIAQYNSPKVLTKGQFDNYSIGVKESETSNATMFIKLTKAQYDKLRSVEDLAGKTLKAYEYENQYGKQVGIEVLQA